MLLVIWKRFNIAIERGKYMNKLNKRQAQVLSAYTGILMCDVEEYKEYIAEVMSLHPEYVDTMKITQSTLDELKNRSRNEFFELIGKDCTKSLN